MNLLPLAVVRRGDKLAITGGKSETYQKTISGLKLSGDEELIRPESLRDTKFHDYQLKDMDYLMWEDWEQILRFEFLPEVVQYVIAPMEMRGTHKNLWQNS